MPINASPLHTLLWTVLGHAYSRSMSQNVVIVGMVSDGSAPGGVPRRESVAMHRCGVQRSLIHPPATRFTHGTAFSLLDHSHSLEHICPDELQCSRLITKQHLARARWSVCPWPSAVPASYGEDSRRLLHSSLHDVIHSSPMGQDGVSLARLPKRAHHRRTCTAAPTKLW